jgi:hypothetical protein
VSGGQAARSMAPGAAVRYIGEGEPEAAFRSGLSDSSVGAEHKTHPSARLALTISR